MALKKNLPNLIFDIIPPFNKEKIYGYTLKYKGKHLHPEIVDESGHGFNIHLSAEDFLDFDAAYVPDGLSFMLILPEHKCMDLMDILLFERENGRIRFDYSFSINDNPPPDIYLNPIKLFQIFTKLAEAEKYVVRYEDQRSFDIILYFPAKGNLYRHYKKHLTVFESLMAKAAAEMTKKILRK